MSPSRPSGAVSSALALALAASLSGAPRLFVAEDEHGHRCTCPAGAHACACPLCAARHAAASERRPCCHGRVGSRPAPERPRPEGPCVTPSCGGRPVVATLAAGAEPFVLSQHPLRPPPGPGAGLARVRLLSDGEPAVPETPPPRA